MAQKKSFRVYFTARAGGLVTGVMIRTWDFCFDAPPPSAIGTSEDDVLRQLEVTLQGLTAADEDSAERYLWAEDFATREVTVIAHPQTVVKKRTVIGAREIPLRLTYAWCKLPQGGYRVMLPRFGWWLVLENLDIAAETLRNAVSAALMGEKPRSIHDFRREGEEWVRPWLPRSFQASAERAKEETDAERWPVTASVADELVDRAARGKLPPTVGESDDFRENVAAFDQEPPPSVVLVGPHGVGKTTFVRRLARHLLTKHRERKDRGLPAPRLWATSATRLIAGMVYVGMWQERCLKLLEELSHEGHWLFVDRLVPLLQPQSDGASIGEILLPAAAEGAVPMITECTAEEYEKCRRRFPSLVEALRVIRVEEPPPYQIPSMLLAWQARRDASTTIHPAAVRRLVQHLGAFQRDTAFPGKAIRFVDWLAAGSEGAADAKAPDGAKRMLYPKDVSELFARHTGLPVELIADDRRVGPDALSATLRRAVVGQDHACDVAARVLARFKAGLNDPERPCGTLLFVGPTGVGKTELARTIARFLYGDERRMVRLDMSEFMFPGSAQGMLEASSNSQSLALRVREQPLSLVLFDEIEKAHADVFDLLLGLLGEGRLTDSYGAVVDFRMTLVVMTSNLGVSDGRSVGFGDAPDASGDHLRAVRRHFRPEFFNRIDHVVPFRALAPDDVLRIVDLELAKAAGRTGLVRRNLRLEVDRASRERLAELGFHPTRGARPLRRVIEERVVSPVAALLSNDPTLRDRTLAVDADGAVTVR